jgi:putative glutamine amidotransferase
MKSSARKPVIGITSGEIYNKLELWRPVAYGQNRSFVDSVLRAGGVPILLPLTTDESVLSQLAGLLDGLYLAGGNDLHPRLYGETPTGGKTNSFSELRDITEQFLLRQAFASNKPVLGICRGMQLLNTQLGGTLYQDIATELPGSIDHDISNKLKKLADLSHILSIKPGSRLAQIVGEEKLGTNAHHHQAVKKLGKGLQATAWASDGVIEAIELIDYPFAVGVQAHPEALTQVEPRWAALFHAFVGAAKQAQTAARR